MPKRELTQADKDAALARLKLLAEEQGEAATPAPPPEPGAEEPPCGCDGCGMDTDSLRMYTDAELIEILAMHSWDARKAAIFVLIRKAQRTDVHIPGGLQLPDQSERYLRMAQALRQSRSGPIARADGT